MFGILGADRSPTSCTSFFFASFPPSSPRLQLTMDLNKYSECLSQWPAHLPAGLPTVGALLLLGTGGLVIACKVWTFLRVILSLFVLPGKPVRPLLDLTLSTLLIMRLITASLLRSSR